MGAASSARYALAMRLVCAGKTDVGRKRQLNEDSFYTSEEYGFCVLADGMGGRDFGEVASSLCVSSFNTYFRKNFPESFRGRPRTGRVRRRTRRLPILRTTMIGP